MIDTNFKIEKNIPMPEFFPQRGGGKYNIHLMEIGDSIFVSGDKKDKIMTSVKAYCSYFGKKENRIYKFLYRADLGGMRVWRIK